MISGRLPWPLVFQVLGVAAAAWVVVRTWQLWVLVFTALVVAAAILPAARFGERHRVPRGATVVLVYACGAAVFLLMGRLLWPALSEQGRQFMAQLPQLIENVKAWMGDLQLWIDQWGGTLPTLPTPNTAAAGDVLGSVLARTFRVTTGVVGALVGILAILVIAAYVVIDAERLGQGLLALVPAQHRDVARVLAEPVVGRMGAYVRGQLAVSVCVGVVLAVGLAILGVRYSLIIGALAAVLNVVPWIGSIVASVLGILSAFNQSPALALATAVLFWGTNFLEAKLLVPQLVGRATGLHPLAVMLALLVGAQLAGLIGALIAVPLLAAAWEIFRILRVGDVRVRSGDTDVAAPP